MKKIFAIALAVVMVLSIASVAGALWEKPASEEVTNANFGYSIDVIKYTRMNGQIGTYSMEANDAATAVNNAAVYFAIKLDVTDDEYAENTTITISSSGLKIGFDDLDVDVPAGTGVFYLVKSAGEYVFEKVENMGNKTPFIETTCLDTDTAKVTAKVTAERPLDKTSGNDKPDSPFTWEGYTVEYYANRNKSGLDNIAFVKDNMWIIFAINSDGVVSRIGDSGNFGGTSFEYDLYTKLGITPAALEAGDIYMTKTNLLGFFGFSFKSTDTATWDANSTPIILDPTVSIPKTGDNASVIGFAMIMVAVVAAAVAVRKVNA